MEERKHVSFVLPALHGGGVERVFLELSKGMAEKGLDVELVVAGGEGVLMDQVDGRVSLVNLGLPRRLRLLRAYRPLLAHLRRSRPWWVVPAWGYFDPIPLGASWAAGSSVLFVLHNTSHYFDDLPPLKRRAALWGVRWALRQLLQQEPEGKALIGGVSCGVLRDFAERFHLPLQDKEVFPNPLDVERVRVLAQASCPHPWVQEGKPFFLAVGRLHPQKGFDLLVEAFARYRRGGGVYNLLILGEGPERGRLEALVSRLGLARAVALPGFVANPYPCFLKAKAMIMTSMYEGFPMVLLEALALGTPVIATEAQGGVAEALGGGKFGVLVPRSVEALAQAMAHVASGQALPPYDQGELRAFLERHRLDRVVEFYLARMEM